MNPKQQFDFWYAVNNTEILAIPQNRLETFGDTIVNYHLICPLMDSVEKIRVREGQLKAFKPEIITPQSLGQMSLEDFGEDAKKYADWLAEHGVDLKILQYGFNIQKREIKEYIITDTLETVTDRVTTEVQANDDPLSAVLTGVDSPWEVCLIKLMVELVQRSAQGNIQDIRKHTASAQANIKESIERSFLEASRDPSKINALAEKLKQHGLFETFEDRFFALVKSSRKK